MKTLNEIIVGVGIIAGLAGATYLNNQGTLREEKNLIYQGYHVNKADNFTMLVFDEKSLEDRYGINPDLRVVGAPKGLEIGKKYDVRIRSPRWIGLDKVNSIRSSD